MALNFDELIAKSYTGSVVADQTAIIPNIIASQLEPNLRKAAVLQQSLVENTDLLGNPGSNVFIPRLADGGTVAALTEGTDISIIALDASDSVEFTPSEVGLAFGITRKALDRIKFDGIAVIVSQLGYAMSLYVEGRIAGLYSGSVPGHGGETVTSVYPNSHTSANVVAGDVFSPAVLQEAHTQLLETNNIPFPDGHFQCYMSPRQYLKFITDDKVRDDIHFSQPQVVMTGEMGIWNNIRIMQTNHIKQVVENTSVNVQKALLVAPRWAAVAWKRRPEIVLDPTIYDFGRRRQFAIVADLDIQLLHADRVRSITTTLV